MTHDLRTVARSVVLIGLLLFCGGAQAAAFPGQARGRGADPGAQVPDLSPNEIQRLLDAYAVMQAQEYLALTDAQFPQFLSRLKVVQETRRRNEQTRTRLLQELTRLSNPNAAQPRDEELRDRLKSLQELETRSVMELQKAYESLDQILDVRQQARFRILEEQMERRKLELLMRARAAGRGGRPFARPPQ